MPDLVKNNNAEVLYLNYAPNSNTNNIPNVKANIIDLKSFLN